MKFCSVFALFTLIGTASFAAAPEMPDGRQGRPGGMDIMANLTAEQKACLEQQNCPTPQMPEMGARPDMGTPPVPGEKPQMPEMTDQQRAEMAAAQECQRAAFETCGIEMPAMPDRQGAPAKGVAPRQ